RRRFQAREQVVDRGTAQTCSEEVLDHDDTFDRDPPRTPTAGRSVQRQPRPGGQSSMRVSERKRWAELDVAGALIAPADSPRPH
ncbi:hypothetical protein ACFVX3_33135, partial [Rhodococcus erythropolis]